MKSGMLAAEAAASALAAQAESGAARPSPLDLSSYETALQGSWVHSELHRERNIRPSFGLGLGIYGGIAVSAIEAYLLRGRAPWTLRHRHADHEALAPAADAAPKEYPKPDGEITFDLNTSLFRQVHGGGLGGWGVRETGVTGKVECNLVTCLLVSFRAYFDQESHDWHHTFVPTGLAPTTSTTSQRTCACAITRSPRRSTCPCTAVLRVGTAQQVRGGALFCGQG